MVSNPDYQEVTRVFTGFSLDGENRLIPQQQAVKTVILLTLLLSLSV